MHIYPSKSSKIHDLSRDYLLNTYDFKNGSPEDFAEKFLEIEKSIQLVLDPKKSSKVTSHSKSLLGL